MSDPYAPAGGQTGSPWTQPTQPSSYAPIPQSGQFYGQPDYGQPVHGPSGYPVPPAPGSPVWHPGMLRTDYARWAKRVWANLIDHLPGYLGLIIFYTGYVMWLIAIMDSSGETVPFGTGGAAMIVGAVIMLASIGWNIYNRWLVGGRTGQSLGKRVIKIKLISEQTDQPIGAMNAFLRDLVHILDAVAYVGYLWPLWDDKRQTFADKIMRTIVIDLPPTASVPARGPGPG